MQGGSTRLIKRPFRSGVDRSQEDGVRAAGSGDFSFLICRER